MEAPSSGGEEGRRGGVHKVARVITPARGMADLALAAQAFWLRADQRRSAIRMPGACPSRC